MKNEDVRDEVVALLSSLTGRGATQAQIYDALTRATHEIFKLPGSLPDYPMYGE